MALFAWIVLGAAYLWSVLNLARMTRSRDPVPRIELRSAHARRAEPERATPVAASGGRST